MRISLFGVLMLIIAMQAGTGAIPAQDHQIIDRTISDNQATHWTLEVSNAPSALYGDIQLNRTGNCEIYVVDGEGFQQWQSSGVPENYIAWATFQDSNLTFWEPIANADTYYLAILNFGPEPVRITGYWGADTDGPFIEVEPGHGQVVSGAVKINVTASDSWSSVVSISLEIDGVQVDTVETDTLRYDWDTQGCADGQHTIKVTSADAAHSSSSKTISITVRNNLPGDPAENGWVVIGVVAVMLFAVIFIAFVATHRKHELAGVSVSYHARDEMTSKEGWKKIMNAVEKVFETSTESAIWYFEVVKQIDSLIEDGSVDLSYKDARRALEVLGEAGILRWLEDDTLVMPVDYESRKLKFLE